MRTERSLEADVLVVGAGAAGLSAAIEAAERGASVVVACKGKAGRSGNTVVARSQFCAVVPFPGSQDSPERHFQDTLSGGAGINDDRLLRVFVERGGSQLLKLEEWGVRLLRYDGELFRRRPPDHSCERGIPTDNAHLSAALGGLSITLPLRAAAEARGVRFLDDTPVLRLLLASGEACGGLALDVKAARLVSVRARAVVVAAGGAGHLYSTTNNARGVSGDSYGLLLNAGATLRDMEFVQYYPCQMSRPFRVVIPSGMFSDGAVLRDRHGERFMHRYDPANGDQATRDVMSRAIFSEVQAGNGVDGEVYLDCTAVPEPVFQKKYASLARELPAHGVELSRDWARVGPTTHFFMGGAEVDEQCRTRVPGLFAAGEAVGGVHGANRISGNALTETVVFGPIAGAAAAQHARRAGRLSEPDASMLTLQTAGSGGELLDEARRELRRAMWDGASIVRSEDSLRSALIAVDRCSEAADRCDAPTAAGAAKREETRLMCLTARAVVLSALAREESRGAHFREDFPSADDRWVGSNRVRLGPEELVVEFIAKAGPA